MNWQSHKRVQFEGRSYGQKDLEFDKFIDVPHRSRVPMEVAVNGTSVPRERLAAHGWTVASGFKATASYQSFLNYILCSTGEFSVCKNIYVALRTGWFSDRSAAYLAAGRPVILQDTGFSEHLPCGKGLMAVQSADEAAEAIREVESDWETHSRSARRIAEEHLDAGVILSRFLKDLNIQ
jgi:hypothetical protein